MLGPLILLFITVPLIELWLLIWVGGQLGLMTTVALVIVTGILGATLARFEGLATLRRFQSRLAAGQLPHEDILDGLLILMAGAVLLTPGLLTDTVGFLLLVPPVRGVVRRALGKRLEMRFMGATQARGQRPGPQGPRPGGTGSQYVGTRPGEGPGRPGGFAATPPRAANSPDIVDAEYTVVEDGALEGDSE
jgi:UPF0716 protein FxsA